MLKNVLIVVDDIEKSIEFYKDLFGLQVILKNEVKLKQIKKGRGRAKM